MCRVGVGLAGCESIVEGSVTDGVAGGWEVWGGGVDRVW